MHSAEVSSLSLSLSNSCVLSVPADRLAMQIGWVRYLRVDATHAIAASNFGVEVLLHDACEHICLEIQSHVSHEIVCITIA